MTIIFILIFLISTYVSVVLGLFIQKMSFKSLENASMFWCVIAPAFLPYSILHMAISEKDVSFLVLFLHMDIVSTVYLKTIAYVELMRKTRRERDTEFVRRKYNRQIRLSYENNLAKQAENILNPA